VILSIPREFKVRRLAPPPALQLPRLFKTRSPAKLQVPRLFKAKQT
jgi:hypothetical protein